MDLKNSFVVFGRSGSGKTTFVIEKILKQIPSQKVFAIDYKNQIASEIKRVVNCVSISEICDYAEKNKNSVFVIDDGSGILRKGNSSDTDRLIRLLSVRRHDNNYYVFVLHSVYFFPQRLEGLIDYFVFFDIAEKQKDAEKVFVSFSDEEIKAATMKKGLYNCTVIKK